MLAKELYYNENVSKNHTSSILLGVLFFSIALIFAYISANLFIIIIIGILPSVVAISVDTEPEHYLSKIVTIFNVVGMFPYLINILFMMENIDNVTFNILSTPYIWFSIYLCAAFGWVIYICVPRIAYHFINLNIESKSKKLEKDLEEIMDEWGKSKILTIIENDNNLDPDSDILKG